MRLLLIAYEFPPSPSPQSLRWTYLCRELAELGHEVHVLAPDLGGETPGLPPLPSGVRVHRSFPGPVRGMLALLRKRKQRKAARGAAGPTGNGDAARDGAAPSPIRPPRSWKQRISETVQRIAEYLHYPDIRGEWRYWGRRELQRLLDTLAPDLVLSSHEPATSLELGLLAARRGLPWVADLGDPVLAGYTAPRWRRRAHRLEREVCERADLVTVTNPAAAALLHERHARSGPIAVLPQGYDDRAAAARAADATLFDHARLELLYTGSFYSFRRIDALLEALDRHPQARLSIAAITVPESILAAARGAPERIRLLGFLPHTAILALQRQADVLVNIANDDITQIPGKFHEYLGAARPILHLGDADPVAEMVVALRRGWSCANTADAIHARLAALETAKADRRLDDGLALGAEGIEQYGWSRIAARLDTLLREVAGPARTT
ncbi:glycosyltransferase [Luteimonas sp. RD2P54]|uniref:Glycosyltransferase n=1 Tax=Luteimonas endophytica TaxID=3042023 RepID=A0ABT6J6J3_9GAMM|nr:glycosyltransferase [Luteimonas endophytica]MDH5822215.1 glycosyltransferase [Luteimonas endophytica]